MAAGLGSQLATKAAETRPQSLLWAGPEAEEEEDPNYIKNYMRIPRSCLMRSSRG